MRIYIAGKITGLPQHGVYMKFKHAERILSSEYEVVNPVELSYELDAEFENVRKLQRSDYMIKSLKGLLSCDYIYMLSDWQDSLGAQLELEIAKQCSIKILYEEDDEITT